MRITDALDAELVHQHDAFGNLVATKDALGNVTRISYDARGRKLALDDPDSGVTAYCYDALGQLKAQQSSAMRGSHVAGSCPAADGAGTTAPIAPGWTTMAYDRLGRQTQRVDDAAYTSSWSFDRYADGSACNRGKGRLCEATTTTGQSRKYHYDNLGRPASSALRISGAAAIAAASSVSFDANGRVAAQVYPSGLQLGYDYTARGYLRAIRLVTALTLNPLPTSPGGTPGSSATLPAGTALWTAGTANAWGASEQSSLGNGVTQRSAFDAASGRVNSLSAGKTGITDVLSQTLVWDNLGQLGRRVDGIGVGGAPPIEVADRLQYDEVGRLVQHHVSGGASGSPLSRSVTFQYNALGMLLGKSDVANYSYGPQGDGRRLVHAVQATAGYHAASYGYNLNGSLTTASAGRYRTVSYTSFDQPATLGALDGAGNAVSYAWHYDDGRQRIRETRVQGTRSRTTWYMHPDNQGGLGFEREITSIGATTVESNRHYLAAGGVVIGFIDVRGALPVLTAAQAAPTPQASLTAVKLEYWHKDHLGSLIATTDHAGGVTARHSYDLFGKRRQLTGSYDAFGNLVVDFTTDTNAGTDRGYTGHEHLDDAGIVHMNGRLFDPLIGRFMQADPFVQDPGNLQNFDRYGYCYNRPLACVDPSGNFFGIDDLMYAVMIVAAARATGVIDTRTARGLLGIAVAIYLGPTGSFFTAEGATYGYAQAAAAGFASGAVSTGSLKGALQGSFSSVLFFGVGNAVPGGGLGPTGGIADAGRFAEAVALHGVAGCVSSVVGGGKCGAGALSAAFSKAATPWTVGLAANGNDVAGVAASAVLGGTGSVLGGGKFANGAQTGAFSYLFNACGNGKCFLFGAKNVEQYYRDGSGKDLVVQMDEIEDLLQDPGVSWTPTKNPNRFVLSTFGRDGVGELSRGRVLGDITVERAQDGSFRVLPDYYNFEQHDNPNNNLRTGLRNAITERAAQYVGPGVSFFIRFEGTFRPTNPLIQKLTEPR